MDSIVSKLSEIEAAAVAIVENAENEKVKLDARMQERTAAFDAELQKDTHIRLAAIESELNQNIEEELTQLKTAHLASMQAIKDEYEAHHEVYAQNILKKIIEV